MVTVKQQKYEAIQVNGSTNNEDTVTLRQGNDIVVIDRLAAERLIIALMHEKLYITKPVADKGEFNGICNITACKTGEPATWYNHGTRKFYCVECAGRLNSDKFNKADAERMFGHTLCTEGLTI